jgi:hypothetical protein
MSDAQLAQVCEAMCDALGTREFFAPNSGLLLNDLHSLA